jgi:hypothetical protein
VAGDLRCAARRIEALMPVATKARWYINRLLVMSPAEVGHRLRRVAATNLERVAAWRTDPPPAPSLQRLGAAWCDTLPETDDELRALLCSAADATLQGRWRVFALDGVSLGFPPAWNKDPKTGKLAPLRFGSAIDYRDEDQVGNIKYLWEPSRHLELVTLAQAWRASAQRRYLDGCRDLLISWFEQCPYPLGVHWASALECSVRLLNWSVAWHLMGGLGSPIFEGADGLSFRRRWFDQIYLHQRFVADHYSRHSSANNHLLGELMGVFVASLTWPCWPESKPWRDQARAEFEREALEQNWDDGVNKEQGIYYHHEVADMMLLCALFGRANDCHFGAAYWQRLERMLGFIDAMMDRGGHVPMFGDADDALMVRFDPRADFDPYKSLLCTGAELFGHLQWRRGVSDDVKTRWLLGNAPPRPAAQASPAAAAAGTVQVQAFPQGGYWLMGSGFGRDDEVKLIADAGPLGYLSIAAHGHADALSLVLSLGGQPVLVDPGTYAYHTQKKWRDYFRGTSAHNTLRIDGVDQSEIGGNFMWLRKARARCLGFNHNGDAVEWLGEHDGYARLSDPLRHRRRIEYRASEGSIRVTDAVVCQRSHRLQWHWHFAPECTIAIEPGRATAEVGGWLVELSSPLPGVDFSLHVGQEEPPLGWLSRRFDRKEPSPTLRLACDAGATREFVTDIRFRRKTTATGHAS